MTETVRVWNDHTEDHVEEFRGDKVVIKAKGFVEMPYPDAVQFRGQFTPIIRDGLGNDLKPKRIRIERGAAPAPVVETKKTFTCMACVEDFPSQEKLDDHTADKHLDEVLDKDAKEKLAKRQANNARRAGASAAT